MPIGYYKIATLMYKFRSIYYYSSSSEAGFTILEVLVALVILSLSIAFLTGTISESLMRAERIDTGDRAVAFADSTIARLGVDIPLKVGISEGEENNLYWRLIVTPESSLNRGMPLDRIELIEVDRSNHLIGEWRTLRISTQMH